MARGGRRRQTLAQGLDKEVYTVVRKILDDRAQYADTQSTSLSFAGVYDEIRASNSSLNRRPKKLLEDSIQRVLEIIQGDRESDSEDFVAVGEEKEEEEEERQIHKSVSNKLNKSIVSAWSTSTTLPPAFAPKPASTPNMESSQVSTSQRLTNGEPRPKKRRAGNVSIDRSPPSHVSLESLGGVTPVIQELRRLLVIPMSKPEIYASNKVQPPRGILLHGPPGCGKTMIANALAAELGVNFISVSATSIVSGMSGESEKALRDLFDEAKSCAPCLLFIDEIDAIAQKRETAQREMEKRIVAQLSVCMDDLTIEKTDGKPVVVLAATNRLETLDAALRRGGRFDKEINMRVPTEPDRARILEALTKGMKMADNVDLDVLAKRTPGFVGADLNDLVLTASATAMERYLDVLQANSDKYIMDVDGDQLLDKHPDAESIKSLRRLVKYIKGQSPSSEAEESSLLVTFEDFLTALPKIQPSALREGFATIPSTTFASIGALDDHIRELTETVISPIRDPAVYTKLGLPAWSGTLLWGPPGCGKTLLAKACANASHANFISVKGPELLNKYLGESERAVRQVFTRARSSVPVIVFFDELDALVPTRDGGVGGGSEASARVVNTLLAELDGVGHSREGIYFIAATNRPDIIDPAMLRPGRLDMFLYVGLPDAEGRVEILRTLCKKVNDLVFDESVATIARECDGFSGADLESLLRRAGLAAVRRIKSSGGPDTIITQDFLHAKTEVRRSVGVEDITKFEALRKNWRK